MTTDAFEFNSKKLETSIVSFGLGASTVAGAAGVALTVFSEQPVQAAPAPEVVQVVASATDTIPVLSGLCMAVFAAGLAPWAARTALSWMSSIMKGAI
jgi:hypothetical protein